MLMLIIASAIFVDFFGGSFSYALFYACLCVPLTSFAYVLYVYTQLKVYQTIEAKITTKGNQIKYYYVLANEAFMFFKSIDLVFMSDYSKVDAKKPKGKISLIPGEKLECESSLTCLYRGEYEVGIESVLIQDCFGLFSMKIKRPSTINARVYPRIIKLSSLAALQFNEDAKVSPFSLSAKHEIPDTELKGYANGDSPKTINWKVSAKYGELFVRRYTELPKERILLFLDTSPVSMDHMILEDALLETTIAIANYYQQEKIESEIVYYTDKAHHFHIKNNEDFHYFYEESAFLQFNSTFDIGEYIQENLPRFNAFSMLIIITTDINQKTRQAISYAQNIHTCAILIGDIEDEELQNIRIQLGKMKCINIPKNKNISTILEKSYD